jgi:hypothetical protein
MIGGLRDLHSGTYLQATDPSTSDNAARNPDQTPCEQPDSHVPYRNGGKRYGIDDPDETFPLDALEAIFLAIVTKKANTIAGPAPPVSMFLANENRRSNKIRQDLARVVLFSLPGRNWHQVAALPRTIDLRVRRRQRILRSACVGLRRQAGWG